MSGTSCKHVQLLCSQGVLSRAGDSQGKKLKNGFGASGRLGGFGRGSSSALGRLGGFGRDSSSALGRLGSFGRGSSSALGRLGGFGRDSSSALGRLGGFGSSSALGGAAHIQQPVTATIFTQAGGRQRVARAASMCNCFARRVY